MGQYYYPVSLEKKEYILSHDIKDDPKEDFGQGLKLMEHSYINNAMMNAVERLLIPGGDWCFTRLVWAGDYADHEKGYPKKKSKEGEEYDNNLHSIMAEKGKKIIPSTKKVDKAYRYLHNHTKKLVIDLSKVKKDSDGWRIHPLSLLVCEGNGRGGGDFRDDDPRVGTWARDVISLEKTALTDYKIISGDFSEERTSIPDMGVGKTSKLKPDLVIGLLK